MADTALDIWNSALLKLGHSPLASLSNPQDTPPVGKPTKWVLVNHFYSKVRDAVLRAHPWNCAIAMQTLVLSGSSPAFGWIYEFNLPSLPYCLRVLNLDDETAPFKIQGRKLLTDEATPKIRYISRITDTTLFDPLLEEAISSRLAGELAYPLAGSLTLGEAMWKLYEAKLREARTMDGMEGTVDAYESNALIEVR